MRNRPLVAIATATVGLCIAGASAGSIAASATPVGGRTRLRVTLIHHPYPRGGSQPATAPNQVALIAHSMPRAALVAQRVASSAAQGVPDSIWAELRWCESRGNYAEDSGNGYYGAYQFTLSSWQAVGESGLPNLAPPGIQDQAAKRLLALQGWRAWPTCTWLLGL